MKHRMNWILMGVGALILIVGIAFFVFWRVTQYSIKDKGGMENPHYENEVTSSSEEESSGNYRH